MFWTAQSQAKRCSGYRRVKLSADRLSAVRDRNSDYLKKGILKEIFTIKAKRLVSLGLKDLLSAVLDIATLAKIANLNRKLEKV